LAIFDVNNKKDAERIAGLSVLDGKQRCNSQESWIMILFSVPC
jgi:hypothetical protein